MHLRHISAQILQKQDGYNIPTFQSSRFYPESPGFWYVVPVSRIESIYPGF